MRDSFDQLVLGLQKAHAGEWAAYLAYEGHAMSLALRGDRKTAERIKEIQMDEWYHRQAVGFMLIELGAEPNEVRDSLMGLVGRIASGVCYFVPKVISGWGARAIETLGKTEYRELAKLARKLGYFEMYLELLKMAVVEEKHEQFFRT